jgi:hypothetical protein
MLLYFLYLLTASHTVYKNKIFYKHNTGDDERPCIKNDTNISVIRSFEDKHNLLKNLQSNNLSELTKLQLIQNSYLLPDLTISVTATNLTKRLEW